LFVAEMSRFVTKRYCQLRNLIERMFCRLKDWRRIAARYDKHAANFAAAAALGSYRHLADLSLEPRISPCILYA
jgi:transposase